SSPVACRRAAGLRRALGGRRRPPVPRACAGAPEDQIRLAIAVDVADQRDVALAAVAPLHLDLRPGPWVVAARRPEPGPYAGARIPVRHVGPVVVVDVADEPDGARRCGAPLAPLLRRIR